MKGKEEGRRRGTAAPVLSNSAVHRNFDRAALTYDRFADVQSEVAQRLIGLLPAVDGGLEQIIELGCGTGYLTGLLRNRYPLSSLIAVDFAGEMVKRAATRLAGGAANFFCSDIKEYLSSLHDQVDLIVSNATLQWIDDLETVVALAQRHLHKNGLLAFSAFGPESLAELQEALDAVLPGKARLAARNFKTREWIAHLLLRYFERVDEESIIIRRDYTNVASLFKQIRKTGTGGAHREPLRFSHYHLEEMDAWFDKNYGGSQASYQVMFFRYRP